jgi:hypothetical protein
MRSQLCGNKTSLPLFIKCGGIFCFLLLAVIVAACGDTSQNVPGTPVATLTVAFGQFNASPTPGLLQYYCGGWTTDTTPAYNANSTIYIYGKLTQTVSGNPQGVGNATATAQVRWPDGTADTFTQQTSSDGLAVFPIVMKPSAINHVVLIQIMFYIPKTTKTCTIPEPAYFTAIIVSPTPTASPSPANTLTPGATPSVTPTGGTPTLTPGISPTASPSGTAGH